MLWMPLWLKKKPEPPAGSVKTKGKVSPTGVSTAKPKKGKKAKKTKPCISPSLSNLYDLTGKVGNVLISHPRSLEVY